MTSRRRFLPAITAALAGAIGLALGIPSAVYLLIPRSQPKDSDWMDAGDLSVLHGDTPQEITFRRSRSDGWKIHNHIETAWLTRDRKGDVHALSPWCTHLGCAYRWEERTGEFICPCHGSRFDKAGRVLSGPASRPLDTFQIKIVGNRLWLAPEPSSQAS